MNADTRAPNRVSIAWELERPGQPTDHDALLGTVVDFFEPAGGPQTYITVRCDRADAQELKALLSKEVKR
jgi:hypothetical protein